MGLKLPEISSLLQDIQLAELLVKQLLRRASEIRVYSVSVRLDFAIGTIGQAVDQCREVRNELLSLAGCDVRPAPVPAGICDSTDSTTDEVDPIEVGKQVTTSASVPLPAYSFGRPVLAHEIDGTVKEHFLAVAGQPDGTANPSPTLRTEGPGAGSSGPAFPSRTEATADPFPK